MLQATCVHCEEDVASNVLLTVQTDRPWNPPILLYSGYRDFLLGLKQSGREIDHPPSPSAEMKNVWSYSLKADSHIACRAHAVPLPCREAKGLDCVFPI
jgi:hypothetical protein